MYSLIRIDECIVDAVRHGRKRAMSPFSDDVCHAQEELGDCSENCHELRELHELIFIHFDAAHHVQVVQMDSDGRLGIIL